MVMVKKLTQLWIGAREKFHNDERGQGMVEYGLIIALVAVVLIAAVSTLSGGIGGIFTGVGTKLSNTATSIS